MEEIKVNALNCLMKQKVNGGRPGILIIMNKIINLIVGIKFIHEVKSEDN
jgi:hypothetical protein